MRDQRSFAEVRGELHLGQPKTQSGARPVALPGFVREAPSEHLSLFPTAPPASSTAPEAVLCAARCSGRVSGARDEARGHR